MHIHREGYSPSLIYYTYMYYMYYTRDLTQSLDHSHVELFPLNDILEFDPIELLGVGHRDLDEPLRKVDTILTG